MFFSWLRAMLLWIFQNRNRRTVVFVIGGNTIVGIVALALTRAPYVALLTSALSVYLVASLTMERYLTLGTACVSVFEIITFLILEPAIFDEPVRNVPLLLLGMAGLTILMMTMITNIQQQDYFSTLEKDRRILYGAIIHALLAARGRQQLYVTILDSIAELYGRSCVIFERGAGDALAIPVARAPQGLIIFDSEFLAATRAFELGKPVGRFSGECTFSPFMHIPLKYGERTTAVLAILFADGDALDPKMREELSGIIQQAESAVERQCLADEQQAVIIDNARERMRSDFLRAISHDIRSPLTGIMSACSTLLQSGERINETTRDYLLTNIHEEAEWLCHMVENLLSVTRVNEELLALRKTPELVEEVIGEVVTRCAKRFQDVELIASTPDEPLLVAMDATLIIQVLMNLIENAVKYADGSDRIVLSVTADAHNAVFSVRDYGQGLSPETLGSLFIPRNRNDTEATHGLGIGLSICRSVIVAHGGEITGTNSPDRGAIFTFTLPLEDTL